MKPLVSKMVPHKLHEKSAGFLILLLIMLLCHAFKSDPDLESRIDRPSSAKPVFIQVVGDVKHPGVYAFAHPPNLEQLVERAGGPRRLLFGAGVSRDIVFSSGRMVVIRHHGEGQSIFQSEMSSFFKITLGIPISPNLESELGLTALPGIGPGLAGAIVRERSARGGFKSLDELMAVKGIGHGLYRRIKPYLTL